jgi:quercetin dioxygenase-like cupin family protein
MKKIKQEDSWQNGQRNAITLLKSDNMRLVLIALRAGEEIDFRQSDNLISLQLLEGNSEFRAVNKTVELKQGNLITLHENMEHSLIAISETIFLLTIGNGDMQTE